jgi:hypothetical protein
MFTCSLTHTHTYTGWKIGSEKRKKKVFAILQPQIVVMQQIRLVWRKSGHISRTTIVI